MKKVKRVLEKAFFFTTKTENLFIHTLLFSVDKCGNIYCLCLYEKTSQT